MTVADQLVKIVLLEQARLKRSALFLLHDLHLSKSISGLLIFNFIMMIVTYCRVVRTSSDFTLGSDTRLGPDVALGS